MNDSIPARPRCSPCSSTTQDEVLSRDLAALQLSAPSSHEKHGRQAKEGPDSESKGSTCSPSSQGKQHEPDRSNTDDHDFAGTEAWDMVFKVAEALIRLHMGRDVTESEWLPKFHVMMNELRELSAAKCNPSDATEATRGSNRCMQVSTLSEYINRVIQVNDSAGISHDMVFLRTIYIYALMDKHANACII